MIFTFKKALFLQTTLLVLVCMLQTYKFLLDGYYSQFLIYFIAPLLALALLVTNILNFPNKTLLKIVFFIGALLLSLTFFIGDLCIPYHCPHETERMLTSFLAVIFYLPLIFWIMFFTKK